MASKHNRFLVLAILCSSVIFLGTTMISTHALGVDQSSNLEVTYNSTEVTLYQNETAWISAEVRLDGDLVSGAYFQFSDLAYDLGEAITDQGDGNYIITFSPSSNLAVTPNNYSTSIVAIRGELNTSTVFGLNLLSYDTTDPTLDVYSPVSGELYTTYMYLNLTGYDEEGWSELLVEFRGEVIFRLFQRENTVGRGAWNTTHLNFTSYIYFDAVEGDNSIRITLFDTSRNFVTVLRSSVGDAQPPTASWVTPLDGSILLDRTVELAWEADDNEGIATIVIRVNNFKLGEYIGSTRNATERLPIPEDEIQKLQLSLIVTDTSGNEQRVDISVEYNPEAYADEIAQQNNLETLLTVGTYFLLTVLGIGMVITGRSVYKTMQETSTAATQQKARFQSFPSSDIFSILGSASIDEEIQNRIETVIVKFKSDLERSPEDVDQLTTDLIANITQKIQETDPQEDATELIELVLMDWKESFSQETI